MSKPKPKPRKSRSKSSQKVKSSNTSITHPIFNKENRTEIKNSGKMGSLRHVVIDWTAVNKLRHDIGLAGEKIAFDIETSKLIGKIEHSSKEKGDGLGYDIRSFDEDGSEIFIEVKTTTGTLKNDIYISRTEWAAMEKYGNKYMLYRIYNLDIENKKYDIKIFKGKDEIQAAFEFFPEKMKAKAILGAQTKADFNSEIMKL